MTWLLPKVSFPVGPSRIIGNPPARVRSRAATRLRYWSDPEKHRAYHREFAQRPEQKARRLAYQQSTLERDRAKRQALRRVAYWRNVERERAAARKRMAAVYERRKAA